MTDAAKRVEDIRNQVKRFTDSPMDCVSHYQFLLDRYDEAMVKIASQSKTLVVAFDVEEDLEAEITRLRTENERLKKQRQTCYDEARRGWSNFHKAKADRDHLRTENERLKESDAAGWHSYKVLEGDYQELQAKRDRLRSELDKELSINQSGEAFLCRAVSRAVVEEHDRLVHSRDEWKANTDGLCAENKKLQDQCDDCSAVKRLELVAEKVIEHGCCCLQEGSEPYPDCEMVTMAASALKGKDGE